MLLDVEGWVAPDLARDFAAAGEVILRWPRDAARERGDREAGEPAQGPPLRPAADINVGFYEQCFIRIAFRDRCQTGKTETGTDRLESPLSLVGMSEALDDDTGGHESVDDFVSLERDAFLQAEIDMEEQFSFIGKLAQNLSRAVSEWATINNTSERVNFRGEIGLC